jgi:hypothetical protein
VTVSQSKESSIADIGLGILRPFRARAGRRLVSVAA